MTLRIFVSVIFLFLLSSKQNVLAQKAGVYLTANDFETRNISFRNNKKLSYKLKINDNSNTNTIKIIAGDSTITLNKDSIFGFIDDEEISYRFYQNKAYQIINPTEKILLYAYTTSIIGKEKKTFTDYFFSMNHHSAIYPLTKFNIKSAFPNDASFHELIDMYFNKDKDLLAYDTFYHVYKISRIYELQQLKK